MVDKYAATATSLGSSGAEGTVSASVPQRHELGGALGVRPVERISIRDVKIRSRLEMDAHM
jgi:hypothetical protein